jgi:hypothetical protein
MTLSEAYLNREFVQQVEDIMQAADDIFHSDVGADLVTECSGAAPKGRVE